MVVQFPFLSSKTRRHAEFQFIESDRSHPPIFPRDGGGGGFGYTFAKYNNFMHIKITEIRNHMLK